MKKPIAILLIVALCFQFFSKIGIVGHYLINKDYIAKVLCINRDKPDMKCEGKCHLKSQFEKQEAQDKRIPVGYKEISETVLFFSSTSIVTPPVALQYFKVNFHPYRFAVMEDFTHAIFHPPQTV